MLCVPRYKDGIFEGSYSNKPDEASTHTLWVACLLDIFPHRAYVSWKNWRQHFHTIFCGFWLFSALWVECIAENVPMDEILTSPTKLSFFGGWLRSGRRYSVIYQHQYADCFSLTSIALHSFTDKQTLQPWQYFLVCFSDILEAPTNQLLPIFKQSTLCYRDMHFLCHLKPYTCVPL